MNKCLNGLLFFVLCSCGQSLTPIKPDAVPPESFWVGGADGGCWIHVSAIDSINRTAHFKIQFENGSPWRDTILGLNCNSKINWTTLQNEIEAYDGTMVLLKTTDGNAKSCVFK